MLDADESFAPLMLRLFVQRDSSRGDQSQEAGIGFDDLNQFFKILMSGDMKLFFNVLFNGIADDCNGQLTADKLVDFSSLVGEPLELDDAIHIIQQCGNRRNEGRIGFDEFWEWYTSEHGSENNEIYRTEIKGRVYHRAASFWRQSRLFYGEL